MRDLILPVVLAIAAAGGGGVAEASCFLPEATPPGRHATLADPKLGVLTRALAAALFNRDLARAEAVLRSHPALAKARIDTDDDMLAVAVASCDPRAVSLLLHRGASADGDGRGVPLGLALMATGPDLAQALLSGGASPTPPRNPLSAFRTAIAAGSTGGVRMLLDFRGDPNVADRLGHRPLQVALDAERFAIAELLLERGADPWAIDSGGGNLGSSVHTPMVTTLAGDVEARRRLVARLSRLGWPAPPPSPETIRALALRGRWPPPGRHAPPVSAGVLRIMADNAPPNRNPDN